MGSSDFLGFSPVQWVEVADPEVLRYMYADNPIFRRIVLDLYRVDTYYDVYDRAEDLFYADEREGDEEEQARSYELAQLSPLPKEKPFALSYRHAAFLSQISPEKDRVAWCIKRLRDTGILDRTPTEIDRARIARRLAQSQSWVENYATENRVKLLDELAPEVSSQLEERVHPKVSHGDRKSTRLNSSHTVISYAVFCLKKKKKTYIQQTMITQI